MSRHDDASCPLTRRQVVDLYFMEHRARLLDLAAFLDRIDRAQPGDDGEQDFRVAALLQAVRLLIDEHPQRARRILELFSDTTSEPLLQAGVKGAVGAYPLEGTRT